MPSCKQQNHRYVHAEVCIQVMKNFAAGLFFFIVGTSSFGLVAAVCMTMAGSTASIFSNTLLFSLPMLWVLWIVLAIVGIGSIKRLIVGWCAIDLFALALLVFLYSSIEHSTGPRGEDIALLIAFSPLVWPVLLLSQVAPKYFMAEYATFVAKSVGLTTPWSDWLGMSILVFLPSVAVAAASRWLSASQSKNPKGPGSN